MEMEVPTELKPCRVCKKFKPATAFAWKLDKNGVRKRSQRCAKCWAAQETKEAAEKLADNRKRRMAEREELGLPVPFTAKTVWGDGWPAAPEIVDAKYWTATDTRKQDAEWAQRFWREAMR